MTWTYPSASSSAIYTVRVSEEGLIMCDCRGWTFRRPNKARRCKHVDDAIATNNLPVEVRGDYVFLLDAQESQEKQLHPAVVESIISEVTGTEEIMATMTTTTATTFEGMKASAMVAGKYGHLLEPSGKIIGHLFDQAFSNGEWVMDEKIDGHRCQIVKRGNEVTTTLRSIPSLPAQIVDDIRRLPFDIHLDGELVVPGGISTDVPNVAERGNLMFLAFDILDVCGEDAMHLPLSERRGLLECAAVHFTGGGVQVVAQVEPTWAAVKAIWANGGEGAILKLKRSPYRPGYRGAEWLKVKRLQQVTVTVTGFAEGSYGPTAVVVFELPNGSTGRCKNRNNELLAATAANPAAFIGRRMVLQCQQITRGGSPRHPMMVGFVDAEADHLAGEAE